VEEGKALSIHMRVFTHVSRFSGAMEECEFHVYTGTLGFRLRLFFLSDASPLASTRGPSTCPRASVPSVRV
jgi:hypothetical protein